MFDGGVRWTLRRFDRVGRPVAIPVLHEVLESNEPWIGYQQDVFNLT